VFERASIKSMKPFLWSYKPHILDHWQVSTFEKFLDCSRNVSSFVAHITTEFDRYLGRLDVLSRRRRGTPFCATLAVRTEDGKQHKARDASPGGGAPFS
jgi:hypothetical protein